MDSHYGTLDDTGRYNSAYLVNDAPQEGLPPPVGFEQFQDSPGSQRPHRLPPIDTSSSGVRVDDHAHLIDAAADPPRDGDFRGDALQEPFHDSSDVMPPEKGETTWETHSHHTDDGTTPESSAPKSSLYFDDGRRRIDYVIAYDTTDEGDLEEASKRQQRRKCYETSLQEEYGMDLEMTPSNGKTIFMKVHAPWEVLCLRAEMMRLKMPIRTFGEGEIDDENMLQKLSSSMWDKTTFMLKVDPDVVPDEHDFYTCAFNRDRMEIFKIDDQDAFFSSAQRSRLTYEILARAPYEEEERERKIGIEQLLSKGVYSAAYPLHDGEAYVAEGTLLTSRQKGTHIPDRQKLYYSWGKFSQFYKEQPLHLIRNYFGEKTAMYFSWLGFYTAFLFPVAVVGIVATVYGASTMETNFPALEICNKSLAGNLAMCPRCRESFCPYWRLETSCFYSKITYLVDNEFTIVFAFVMAIWTVLFLEFWKRQQARLAFDWDLIDELEDENSIRPDFEARCQKKKKNLITGIPEPYFPTWARFPRYVTGLTVVIVAICCVLMAITGVIFYRVIMRGVLSQWKNRSSQIIITVTSATINLIVIMILNRLYGVLALKLTQMENQKTDKDYEDSYTLKMFCFQFVNYYSSIFYIAFFKGRFFGFFKNRDNMIKESPAKYDECDPAGCLIELFLQMLIIMVGKQIYSNVQEFLLPRVWNCYRRHLVRRSSEVDVENFGPEDDELRPKRPQWENDYALSAIGDLGLFNEYLEMVIQFGFVTLFVTAFPLAPVFALLNNIIEIRLDANKFTCSLRRQRPMRVKDIGAWFYILSSIARLAVITNALVIAFTSNFIERIFYMSTRSPDGSLEGFVRFSLSKYDTNDLIVNVTRPSSTTKGYWPPENDTCYYRDYRNDAPDYERNATWYHVMLAKVVFVLVFEHVVYFIRDGLAWVVPDIPSDVLVNIKREAFLGRKALYDRELAEKKEIRKQKSVDVDVDVDVDVRRRR